MNLQALHPTLFRGARLAIFIAALGQPAHAQEAGNAPAGPPRGGDMFAAGAAVLWEQSPIVGVGNKVLPIPFLMLTRGRFHISGPGLGYTLDPWGGFGWEIGLRAETEGWDSSDSHYLEGMSDRHRTAEAGLKVSHRLGNGFEVEAGAWQDVLNVHKGWSAELGIARPIVIGRRLILTPGARVELLSASKAHYYYGVRHSEARPGRPAYDPGTTWMISAGMRLVYAPGGRLSYFLMGNARLLSSELQDSPVVEKDISYGGGGGASWRF